MRRARPKLLVVGIDGARADVMARVAERGDGGLARLVRRGAWSFAARSARITVSGPAWASALTGTWIEKHGIRDHDFRDHRLADFPHFLGRVRRAAPASRTASIVNWAPINSHLLDRNAVDVAEEHPRDELVCRRATALLREDADLDALFVHLDEVDVAGHHTGYHRWSPFYVRAARRADAMLATFLDAIAARPTRGEEAWLVVTLADHGGRWFGHGADVPANARVHFVAGGDGVVPGPLRTAAIVDLAPTCLAHLGIAVEPGWDLDGAVRGLPTDGVVAHEAAPAAPA
jgi:predicted AlkP superfamily pyrophosphatase or phosphodiesterase